MPAPTRSALRLRSGPWTFNAVIGKKNDKTVADKDFSMWSLGGEYALSKRTAFYGSWTKCNNNDNHTTLASTCVLNSALNTGLQQVVSGGKFTYDPALCKWACVTPSPFAAGLAPVVMQN